MGAARHHIPGDSVIHNRRCDNNKSDTAICFISNYVHEIEYFF